MRKYHVMRFMSDVEAAALLCGVGVHSIADHHKDNHAKTDSVGSCFMIIDGRKTGRAYHTARYLSGVVNLSVLLYATVDREKFKLGYGRYADYDKGQISNSISLFGWPAIIRPELSATKYSLSDFEHWSFWLPEGAEIPVILPHNYLTPIFKKCNCKIAGSCVYARQVEDKS